MSFFGEVNSATTQSLLNLRAFGSSFVTASTGFTAPIDRLRLQISAVGPDALYLDNLVLTPGEASSVPEPSTAVPLGLAVAAGATGIVRRRRRRLS